MSGIGFFEFLILCMIGLVVLGPKRLPQVASQLGSWVGQARRLTRSLKRQLEEELDFEEELNLGPTIHSRSTPPASHPPPRDDDTYSPMHEPSPSSIDLDSDGSGERDEFDVEPDFDDEDIAAVEAAAEPAEKPEDPSADEDDGQRST
ncbi:MAG: Sec-independent protein translocase protein TatB [Woeseiaceae bacterium]|nr:Sec-independent protein translocase protein TatB [Woeseiaceae bacterium]